MANCECYRIFCFAKQFVTVLLKTIKNIETLLPNTIEKRINYFEIETILRSKNSINIQKIFFNHLISYSLIESFILHNYENYIQ